MNHLYFEEEKVRCFAQALAKSRPFAEGEFLLYRDVPLKSLEYDAPCFLSARNLETMDAHTALQAVDYLVCRDKRPVLGITFDFDTGESKHIFGTVLRGVAHIAVNSCDFQREDYDRDGLLQQVLQCLEDMPNSDYVLPVYTVLPACYLPDLQHLGMISKYGNATLYGKDCGMFFQCCMDAAEHFTEFPVVAGSGWREYRNAMDYAPEGSDGPLRKLLRRPVAELYQYDTAAWEVLRELVQQAEWMALLPAGGQLVTLSDYLVFLKRYTGTEKVAPEAVRQLMQRLRTCIVGRLCLGVHYWDDEVLRMPLQEFCEEAARITGSDYPQWFYRRQLRPYLNGVSGAALSFSGVLRYAVDGNIKSLEYELMELLFLCGAEIAQKGSASVCVPQTG